MPGLTLHCGGQPVSEHELDLVPVPERTETYTPVPHGELVRFLRTVGSDLLGGQGYELGPESYGLAAEGRRMFAVMSFIPSEGGEMRLSIGYRNSYDKSMSVGIALGASVFVCDNLALSGEITILRKHTKGVWEALQELAITSIYRAGSRFREIKADAEAMRALPLDRTHAFRLLGGLFGEDVISVRQLVGAAEAWDKPAHEEFQPRNVWSLYNACTDALKSTNPMQVMERHTRLHRLLSDPEWTEISKDVHYLPPVLEDA
jgi:hypothetical protein